MPLVVAISFVGFLRKQIVADGRCQRIPRSAASAKRVPRNEGLGHASFEPGRYTTLHFDDWRSKHDSG